MKKYAQTIIIGGGPAGLYIAGLLEKNSKDYLLLNASDELGGQLTRLYPEKIIVDIPGIAEIKAKDYIKKIAAEINLENVLFNQEAISIGSGKIKTKTDEFTAENIIICTGLGFSKPRPLGLEGEEDCSNILYSLKDFSFLKDKKVAIFGGGDSALDWAREISAISNDAHLIHRRTEFRGNADTIANIKNLSIHLPFVPYKLNIKNGKVESVIIKEVKDECPIETKIDVDYILVNFGNVPFHSPFDLPMAGPFIKVDDNYQVVPGVYAIGDVAAYENKKRRIAPSIAESEKLFTFLFR